MSDDLPLPDLPDLELEDVGLGSAPPAGTFRVQVGPVRDPVEMAPHLASILGVDLATAAKIAANAPGVLVSGAPQAIAHRIAVQVEALGLKARVEDEAAPPERPSSLRPGAPSERPAPTAPTRPGKAAPPTKSEAPGGFWMQAPVAFVAPFLGKGALLLGASGLAGLGVAVLAFVPGLCLKLGVLIALQLVALGIFVETFNRLAQAAIYRDEDSWLPEPMSELPEMSALFWRGVVNLLVFALLGAPAVLLAYYTRSVPVAIGCQLALFLYWPMALTVQSVSGRMAGPFDVLTVARGIFAAPLEYLAVCVLTIAAIAGSTAIVLAITGVTTLGAQAAGGGIGSGLVVFAVVAFVWYAAIAYFHGVLGYLMGALVRSKGDAFAFMQKG